jgi:hypothetical protein
LAILLEEKKNSSTRTNLLKDIILVILGKWENRDLWNILHQIPAVASKEVKYEGDNTETDYLGVWASLQDALKEFEQNKYTQLAHSAESFLKQENRLVIVNRSRLHHRS